MRSITPISIISSIQLYFYKNVQLVANFKKVFWAVVVSPDQQPKLRRMNLSSISWYLQQACM
ncbi:hypothetical protein BH11BAC5_BH11BAC5_22430 [soil metagenome]